MFRDVLKRDGVNERVIARCFCPHYVQKVDGKALNSADFLDHVRKLKRTVSNLRATFEHMVVEDDKLTEIHRVEADKRAGGKSAARMKSLWVISVGHRGWQDRSLRRAFSTGARRGRRSGRHAGRGIIHVLPLSAVIHSLFESSSAPLTKPQTPAAEYVLKTAGATQGLQGWRFMRRRRSWNRGSARCLLHHSAHWSQSEHVV